MPLRSVAFDTLTIDDEASFGHVALYRRLKRALRGSDHRFWVPEAGTELSWDRAVFLNLTYWSGDAGADVLCEPKIAADVVAHVAWHHLAGRELAQASPAAKPSAEALLFGEAIASAFDLYLVGRLLPNVPDSDFIESQVPIMREAAEEAGATEAEFAALLQGVCDAPEQAFEALRSLLFDASRALLSCRDPADAQRVLEGFAGHRFSALLHHYQLSNWVLYGRAYAAPNPAQRELVERLDASLRGAPDSLEWLAQRWLPEG